MSIADGIFQYLAASQLLLLMAVLLTHHRRDRLALVLALLCLCTGAYVLASTPLFESTPVIAYFARMLATATPAVLWVLSFYVFVDNGRVRQGIWLLIGLYLMLRGIGVFQLYQGTSLDSTAVVALFFVIPQFIMLTFTAHSVYLAIKGREDDLLEQRRQLRQVFAVVFGLLVILVVGQGLFSMLNQAIGDLVAINILQIPSFVYAMLIFSLVLAFNISVLRLHRNPVLVLTGGQDQATGEDDAARQDLVVLPEEIERIHRAMDVEHLYTRAGLTIRELADVLDIREYRLRKIINRQLGFQNFNQFLNNYRIRFAAQQLIASDKPVSTIASESGFSSLSSFNKAFRDVQTVTPSEYRARQDRSGPQ